MASVPKSLLTPEEYLERERNAEFKSEYLNGEIFAMAGATLAHFRISRNLVKDLLAKLNQSCELFYSDIRLEVSTAGLFTYPDAMVVCGDVKVRRDAGMETILNPTVIFEVLSPSTSNYDKGEKFDQYQTITSLQTYVLIAQHRVHVETRVRQQENQWLITNYWGGENQSIPLKSIGVNIEVSSLYDKVFDSTA